MNLSVIWMFLLSTRSLSTYVTGRIAPEEQVIFFPTSASQLNETHWKIPIHGWIYDPKLDNKKRKAFLGLMRVLVKRSLTENEEYLLNRRLQAFVVDNARWKRPKVILGGKEYRLSASSKDGHFETTLIVPASDLKSDDSDSNHPSLIRYHALSSDRRRHFEGKSLLIPKTGISIVSDIDDTIKHTDVVHKKAMIRNTFTKNFEAVPGMADVYKNWYNRLPNASFHWLSASLYQLYSDLEDFREHSDFPPASIALKKVRPKSPKKMITTLLEDPLEYKHRYLVELFETYPQRKFVLVGDTGEKDPQVYARMAREYPNQVSNIFLRAVPKSAQDNVEERVANMMDGVAKGTWKVFHDASELLDAPIHSSPSSKR